MVDTGTLRVAFFGTPEFSVPTLEALLSSGHQVVGVITQPDRPRGRGQKVSPAAVKVRALAAGLTPLQPTALKDAGFLAAFDALRPDLGVVVAYGKILPQSLIDTPRLGMINVHASLLPRYRGAAPIHRAVIAGETETGVTVMRMVKALDAGPMIATARRAIDPDETSVDVERDLAVLGARLLASSLEPIARGTASEQAQDDAAATYAPRLTKGDGLIDWSLSARAIHNRIRGLHPWPLAYTYWRGQRLILRHARPSPDRQSLPPGTIIETDADAVGVSTGDGTLALLELQTEGGRAMTAREFRAGRRLQPGEVLRSTV